jgi:NTE family protein
MSNSTPSIVPIRRAGAVAGPVTAFVLPGGGAQAATQVGMLRALLEAGVVPDLLIGTSAGALNAVAFATDPTPAGVERLSSLWLRMRRRDVAGIDVRNIVRSALGRADGLFTTAPLERVLSGMVAPRLDGTVVPVHVVATELDSGRAVVLSDSATVPALLASAAFPGLYAPVSVDGVRLMDGGVAADVPVRQAATLGAEMCFVLPAAVTSAARGPMRGPLATAYRALGHMLDATARRDIETSGCTVSVLPTATSSVSHPLDFRHTPRLIAAGYRLARSWLNHPATGHLTAHAVPA